MDEVIFNDDKQEPVEEAIEVFQEDVTENNSQETVETAFEIGLPFPEVMQEQNTADYVAQFGTDIVYHEERANDNIDFSGDDSDQGRNDPVYVPVLDDETKSSIEQIESTVNDLEEKTDSIVEYLAAVDFELQHIEQDVVQFGRNHALASKVSSGCIVALLGAVVVYALFSKLK